MIYRNKALKIQDRLSNYNQKSVFEAILRHLHAPTHNIYEEAQKMPWVCFLAIEWLYQIQPKSNAKTAKPSQVHNILNQIYLLQSEAVKLNGPLAIELGLRKIMIGQMRCQRAFEFHLFSLSRLYSLMDVKSKSNPFKQSFLKVTGVELKDFFTFSLWILAGFKENRCEISYENILLHFYPEWNIAKIAKVLRVIGNLPVDLKLIIDNKGNCSPEQYFSKPQLLKSPIFLTERTVQCAHISIVTEGISELALQILKTADNQGFRKKFTVSFERYVETVLKENDCSFITENEIKEIYQSNGVKAKVVDFLYQSDGAVVFIDAKGVEPHAKILVSEDQRVIRDKLKDSYLKGIEQAAECAETLEALNPSLYQNRQKYALIITHQDFYLGFGKRLKSILGPDNTKKIVEQCGETISLDKTHFCSIEDFESIMAVCNQANIGLNQFLDFCSEQQENPASQKFTMRQHIEDFTKERLALEKTPLGTDLIAKEQKEQLEALASKVLANQLYWRNKGRDGSGINEFISKYKQLLKLVHKAKSE